MVSIPGLKATTLRLGREPVPIEAPERWPVRRVPEQSVFESLLVDVRAYALAVGWSEAETFDFLTGGTVPKPAPIVARVILSEWGEGVPGSKVVVLAAPEHVAPASVMRVFQRALKRQPGRPVEASTNALVEFVKARLRGGKRPPWPALWRDWKRERPPGSRPYRSYADFRRTFVRAAGPLKRARSR